MANKRIFFAVYAVGLAKDGFTTYTPIHGLQSVGITTTFNLEQVFEIGQINIYENIENIPDVEVTLEKVLDGYPPIYILATQQGTSASLTGRSNAKCAVAMSIFGDTQDAASGTPLREVNMSGMYVSNLSYNFPVDGNFSESVTLVGNHRLWKNSSFTFTGSLFNNADQPLALGPPSSGGVNRRKDIIFGGLSDTLLPAGNFGGIPGISASGTNDKVADVFGAHIQRIAVSASLGRTNINELGRKSPYFRYLEFPVEVTTEIETNSTDGDLVSATEEGVVPGSGVNLADKTIRIKTREGTVIDLGTRNKLSSVSTGNASATGGNLTDTFTYTGFNILTVTHAQDPSSLT